MFCSQCGKEAQEEAKFCSHCGVPVAFELNHDAEMSSWTVTSQVIVKNLSKVRKAWFEQAMRMIQASGEKIINDRLEGLADYALKGYQYFMVIGILHRYIPSEKGKNFSDILFTTICGSEMDEVLKYFSRYMEPGEDEGGQSLMRFCNDLARHITGNEHPLEAGLAVGEIAPPFILMTEISVADAFGDKEGVAKVQQGLDDLLAKNK